jgi:hypothetical protein
MWSRWFSLSSPAFQACSVVSTTASAASVPLLEMMVPLSRRRVRRFAAGAAGAAASALIAGSRAQGPAATRAGRGDGMGMRRVKE